jgi:hypothetical protein
MQDNRELRGTKSASENSHKPSGLGSLAKGILILILLIVCAGAGGYFFGTYQKFAPIEYVKAGAPGAVPVSSVLKVSANNSPLKKKYWLSCTGDNHIGYVVTVSVNGQVADKFDSPGKTVDITGLVHPGENQVRFEAKSLPESMHEHLEQGGWGLYIAVIGSDKVGGSHTDSEELLHYARKGNDKNDFDETKTFQPLE